MSKIAKSALALVAGHRRLLPAAPYLGRASKTDVVITSSSAGVGYAGGFHAEARPRPR